jgi:uncharacterized repeat protein (TIGR03803 family)
LSKNSGGFWNLSTIYAFHGGSDGAFPVGGLTFDKAGNLYGVTYQGGSSPGSAGFGVIFELSPTSTGSWNETVLFTFNGADGAYPVGKLIFDTAGNLYGTADGYFGTIFKLSPTSSGPWTQTTLYSFGGGHDGAWPSGGVIFDAAGNLYGTVLAGAGYQCPHQASCGAVFILHPNSSGGWYESHIDDFDGSDGYRPMDRLIADAAGNLYGTTLMGGTAGGCGGYGCGLVYKLSGNISEGWTETVLHDFGPGTSGKSAYLGQYPYTGLTFDASGNLYGTTVLGGQSGDGVVFELSPSSAGGWQETLVHSFAGANDGINPDARVLIDASGDLFGTTLYGGSNTNCNAGVGCGVVYEITP